ncbi:MAG TPA: P-loop NTPase fold protein [bacterium]|nr:P-loop NTPase fold protein [bacterium]
MPEPNKIRYHGVPDQPLESLEKDKLKLRKYAEALATFLLECDTPLTVGIQGDWGTGKTSLMNMIKEIIDNFEEDSKNQSPNSNFQIIHVWFNTWLYSQFDLDRDVASIMLTHFVSKLTKGDDDDNPPQLSEKAKDAARSFVKLVASAATKKFAGMDWAELVNMMEKKESIPSIELEELKNKFSKLCKELTEKNPRNRIIFYVDDLDRLLPEKAVELLEVMKNFLDVPQTIFVLACDYKIIKQGINQKFKYDSELADGRSFFDKIIQVPFQMPTHSYDFLDYIGEMLRTIDWPDRSKSSVSEYRDILNLTIGSNPRSIKRLFNSLLLIKIVMEKENELIENGPELESEAEHSNIFENATLQKILFATVCMEMAHKPLHRYLASDPTTIENLSDEKSIFDLIEKGEVKYEGKDPRSTLMPFVSYYYNLVNSVDEDDALSDKDKSELCHIFNVSNTTSVIDSGSQEKEALRSNIAKRKKFLSDLTKQEIDSKTIERVDSFIDRISEYCKAEKWYVEDDRTISFVPQFLFKRQKTKKDLFSLISDGNAYFDICNGEATGDAPQEVISRTIKWIKSNNIEYYDLEDDGCSQIKIRSLLENEESFFEMLGEMIR